MAADAAGKTIFSSIILSDFRQKFLTKKPTGFSGKACADTRAALPKPDCCIKHPLLYGKNFPPNPPCIRQLFTPFEIFPPLLPYGSGSVFISKTVILPRWHKAGIAVFLCLPGFPGSGAIPSSSVALHIFIFFHAPAPSIFPAWHKRRCFTTY